MCVSLASISAWKKELTALHWTWLSILDWFTDLRSKLRVHMLAQIKNSFFEASVNCHCCFHHSAWGEWISLNLNISSLWYILWGREWRHYRPYWDEAIHQKSLCLALWKIRQYKAMSPFILWNINHDSSIKNYLPFFQFNFQSVRRILPFSKRDRYWPGSLSVWRWLGNALECTVGFRSVWPSASERSHKFECLASEKCLLACFSG